MKKEAALERVSQCRTELGLETSPDDVYPVCGADGNWFVIISRSGYRKVVSRQEDYVEHSVYPLYENTEIKICDTQIKVSIGRGNRGDLLGAFGVLRKTNDRMFTWQVSIDDYKHLGDAWMKMPETMTVKVGEVGLFRIAYPELFANTYSNDEVGKLTVKNMTRSEKIKFIQEHVSEAKEYLEQYNVKVTSLSNSEVDLVYSLTIGKMETAEREQQHDKHTED